MRSRLARTLVGLVAFFAPTDVAITAALIGRTSIDGPWSGGLLAAGALSLLVAGIVPARLFLRSGLPPNTRIGLAIVALALVFAQGLSILYVVLMRGTTV